MLLTGLSATAAETKANLPKPIVVVAPEDVPHRFANTTVRVSLTLDATGCPSNIRVISPNAAYLDKSVVAALSQWRFSPMVRDGSPVAQNVVLPLTLKTPPM